MTIIILDKKILSGHDISDGGLITCLLEMAFGGFCGIHVDLTNVKHASTVNNIEILFAEELGWILEVDKQFLSEVILEMNVPFYVIGSTIEYGNKSNVRLH